MTNLYIDGNGSVLSLLPELGTMGSKWGGVGVTRSSTSYEGCAQKSPDLPGSLILDE